MDLVGAERKQECGQRRRHLPAGPVGALGDEQALVGSMDGAREPLGLLGNAEKIVVGTIERRSGRVADVLFQAAQDERTRHVALSDAASTIGDREQTEVVAHERRVFVDAAGRTCVRDFVAGGAEARPHAARLVSIRPILVERGPRAQRAAHKAESRAFSTSAVFAWPPRSRVSTFCPSTLVTALSMAAAG